MLIIVKPESGGVAEREEGKQNKTQPKRWGAGMEVTEASILWPRASSLKFTANQLMDSYGGVVSFLLNRFYYCLPFI